MNFFSWICWQNLQELSSHLGNEENGESEELSIAMSWKDCDMAENFWEHNTGTILEYTVEISPETEVS